MVVFFFLVESSKMIKVTGHLTNCPFNLTILKY